MLPDSGPMVQDVAGAAATCGSVVRAETGTGSGLGFKASGFGASALAASSFVLVLATSGLAWVRASGAIEETAEKS